MTIFDITYKDFIEVALGNGDKVFPDKPREVIVTLSKQLCSEFSNIVNSESHSDELYNSKKDLLNYMQLNCLNILLELLQEGFYDDDDVVKYLPSFGVSCNSEKEAITSVKSRITYINIVLGANNKKDESTKEQSKELPTIDYYYRILTNISVYFGFNIPDSTSAGIVANYIHSANKQVAQEQLSKQNNKKGG